MGAKSCTISESCQRSRCFRDLQMREWIELPLVLDNEDVPLSCNDLDISPFEQAMNPDLWQRVIGCEEMVGKAQLAIR